jgi:hypothetical protein
VPFAPSARWGLPRWSDDGDAVTREQFDDGFARLDTILYPAYTTVQRDALVAADRPPGTIIFNTTTGLVEVRNAAGTGWVEVNPAWGSQLIAASESTTSTAYTDLATVGPTVTITVPASGRVLVIVTAELYQAFASKKSWMDFEESGANVRAASDATALVSDASPGEAYMLGASRVTPLTGLNPGVTTFRAKYRTEASASLSAAYRSLVVVPG